eukprot:g14696.t1
MTKDIEAPTRKKESWLRNRQLGSRESLEEMGKVLYEYFSSVFTVEKDTKTLELGGVSGDILGTVHITMEEVLEVLECMKV